MPSGRHNIGRGWMGIARIKFNSDVEIRLAQY